MLGSSLFSTFNGLPLHPLVVHAVVVLLPLSALGAIVVAVVPRWSPTYGPLVWAGAFVSAGAAWVAQESGEALAAKVGVPPIHMEYGEKVKFAAALLFVLVFILWWMDRRTAPRSLVGKLLAAAVVIVAVGSIAITFLAGDSGAQAVWG